MARVQKVKQIITENLLPEKAEFGTVFVCRDTQQVWFTARNGDVLNLSDLLEGKTASVRQVGPTGPKGGDSTVQGPKGDKGEPGRDGKDGRDSTVPGPKGERGESIKGDKGDKGERGLNGIDGRDGESADITTLSAQVAALQATVNALLDMNKRGADYIAYLQEKVKRGLNS